MNDNNTQDWTMGLKFVPQQKKCAHHAGINRTPNKAMFRENSEVGLTASTPKPETLRRLQSKDDLRALHQAPPLGSAIEALYSTLNEPPPFPASN